MLGQVEKGLVFLNVGSVRADQGAVFGDDTEVFPGRSRLGNRLDVDGSGTDGLGER